MRGSFGSARLPESLQMARIPVQIRSRRSGDPASSGKLECHRTGTPPFGPFRPLRHKECDQENVLSDAGNRTGKDLPWGSLTGIRPTKIALTRLYEGWQEEDIRAYMKDTYMASDEKIDLSIDIAAREKQLLKPLDYREWLQPLHRNPLLPDYLPYIVPLPPIRSAAGREGPGLYLQALFTEMEHTWRRKMKGLSPGYGLFWRWHTDVSVSRRTWTPP